MNETFKLLNIEEQQQMDIIQKNNFIQKARVDLSTYELKIIDFVISKIKPEHSEFKMVNTSLLELMEVLKLPRGGTTYRQLADDLLALKSKGFYVLTDQGKSITATSWLGFVRIHEDGRIDVRLDEFLAPFLLELALKEGQFTSYPLSDIIKLKSRYTILMYKLIQSVRFKSPDGKKPVLSWSTDEISEYFGQPNWPFYKVNSKILKKAQKELDDKGIYKLKYTYKKKGNKIMQVDIYAIKLKEKQRGAVKQMDKKHIETTEITKVPLHNWLN